MPHCGGGQRLGNHLAHKKTGISNNSGNLLVPGTRVELVQVGLTYCNYSLFFWPGQRLGNILKKSVIFPLNYLTQKWPPRFGGPGGRCHQSTQERSNINDRTIV